MIVFFRRLFFTPAFFSEGLRSKEVSTNPTLLNNL